MLLCLISQGWSLYSLETNSVLLLSYFCLPILRLKLLRSRTLSLVVYTFWKAIYSLLNNYVWSSQDTSIGFSHKESSLKSTLKLKHNRTTLGTLWGLSICIQDGKSLSHNKAKGHSQGSSVSRSRLWSQPCVTVSHTALCAIQHCYYGHSGTVAQITQIRQKVMLFIVTLGEFGGQIFYWFQWNNCNLGY